MMTMRKIETMKKNLAGIYNLSPVTDKDPFFSPTGCPVCGSELGGNRYEFTDQVGKVHTGRRIELCCCIDCYEYFFT